VAETGSAISGSQGGELPRPRARVALLAGFGTLLVIIVVGAVDMWVTLGELRNRSSTILNEYLRRDEILSRARDDAYLSTTYVRDFVLDPEPSHAQAHLQALEDLRSQLDSALAEYRPLVDTQERSAFRELTAGVEQYWKDADPVFGWTPEQRRRDGFRFLAQSILPQRARLVSLTDAISSINEQELHRRETQLSDLYHDVRWRLGLVLLISLVLGTVVAIVSLLYLSRLEQSVRTSFDEVLRTREELKRLSMRLVEAHEQERRALSRELHDEVGQSLSALLLDVAIASASAPPDNTELAERHKSIRRLAEQTLHVIRNMSLLLRPSMLDDLGLLPALEWQARETSRRTGTAVEVESKGLPEELPEQIRTCIYRVVQEALNNCVRHAAATRVDIILRVVGKRFLILIRDDGVGFDPRATRGGSAAGAGRAGVGLIGLEERVRTLGGMVRVESSPGRGCLVQAELPLEYSAPAQIESDEGPPGGVELTEYDHDTAR